jgi:endonuclease/exonuclease/phosphatase family metal-dependent hydrolase
MLHSLGGVRRVAVTGVVAICVTISVVAVVVSRHPAAGDSSGADHRTPSQSSSNLPPKEQRVRIGSLNVLAAEHTRDTAATQGRADGDTRPRLIAQIVERNGLDVVGLHGLPGPMLTRLEHVSGPTWRSYPHRQPRDAQKRAAIAWRTTSWHRVKAKVARVEQPGGSVLLTPYVLLRNVTNEREVYVVNIPERARALSEPRANGQALVTRLRTSGKPVIVTSKPRGDGVDLSVDDPAPGLDITEAKVARSNSSFSFRVGSYNVLGASHTARGGNKKGWASGSTRMGWSTQLVRQHGLDVVGFQEMQASQLARFQQLTGGGWSVYPGTSLTQAATNNSIAWRDDVWETVSTDWINIPYFGGHNVQMPYVLLRHRESQREVYFANFHNPADTPEHRGNQRWRDRATQLEIALVNRLHADGTPVVVTGDMNERERFFCPMTSSAPVASASGGSTGTPCQPARPLLVDWVLGTTDLDFSGYTIVGDGIARRASDHPLVLAEATLLEVNKPAELRIGDFSLPEAVAEVGRALEAWGPAKARMEAAVRLLGEQDVDVVGFQELRPSQLRRFVELVGTDWSIYPGHDGDGSAMQGSIAWRTDIWNLSKSATIEVKTAKKRMAAVPYVLLVRKSTGEQLYVINTYHPNLGAHDLSEAARTRLNERIVALVKKLGRSGKPVVVTGGMSGASTELCKLDRGARLVPAGVDADGPACPRSLPTVADPIVGTSGVAFSNFSVLRNALVMRATDRPLVTADMTMGESASP